MPLDYRRMSLAAIASDLSETLNDLAYNALREDLRPVAESVDLLSIPADALPSEKLVATMEELLTHDANLFAPRAQILMREAAAEVVRLASV